MKSPLSELVANLSVYDSIDVLAAVAGLQLMPENIERTLRLEALAHVATSLSSNNNKPKISGTKLGRICNLAIPKDITRMEDPFESPFTDEISFFGGSYIVFPGYGGDSVFVLRHLLKAIFLFPNELGNSEFISKARELISAVLSISDEVAHNIGLKRGIKPIVKNNRVTIPKNPCLDQLKQAVSFEQSRLAELLAKKDTNISALEGLIIPFGTISISKYKINNGELLIHPIVKTGEKYIVAIPGMLLWAARHELIHLAIEHNVCRELAKNFNKTITSSVIEYLSYLGNNLDQSSSPSPPEITCFNDAFFTLDSDKIIYAMIFTDSLDNYDLSDINGRWQTDGLDNKILNRLRDVVENVFCTEKPPNDIIFLFLFQGVGRMFMFGTNEQFNPFGIHFMGTI